MENSKEDLTNLYYLYQFSEDFSVWDDNEQFGSIWNYVEQGVISVSEALQALTGVDE